MKLRPGARLRSAVCTTELVAVRVPDEDVDLRCGGAPMLPIEEEPVEPAEPRAGFADGTQLGKRYGEAELELLCTKAGEGSLSVGTTPLPLASAKPLPSSD